MWLVLFGSAEAQIGLLHLLTSVFLPCLGDALPLLAMTLTCVMLSGAQYGFAQLPSPSISCKPGGQSSCPVASGTVKMCLWCTWRRT